jgi:hypothetical protein
MTRSVVIGSFLLAFAASLMAPPVMAQVDLKKMNAELGLNPEVSMPPSQRTSSSFTNIRVHESTNHQSEISASISPVNSLRLISGANTDPGQGYYYSTNGGTSWDGSDRLLQTTAYATDPAVAFDRNGYAYFNFLDYVNGRYRNYVARSTDGGATWQSAVEVPTTSSQGPDKNYMAIDVNAGGSYENYIYTVWTDFPGSNPIRFSRSTNGGQSFSGNLNISGGTTVVQGAVPAVGPNGDVFVVWGIGNPAVTGIGFNRSTNGGSSFMHSTPPTITSVTQIGTFSNNRYRLKITQQYPNGIRVNSFPSIAVDRSGSSNNGSIYVVWADQRSGSPGSGTPDILLIKSTNNGTNWSSPVRVNDVTTGDQWFPWVDVGPDGAVNVVFYDSRNDQNNLLTECYVARSTDGGQTFTNYQVSDEQFTPVAIPGYASGYMGDYIGIASAQGKCYPFWMDNRNDGIYQVYTAVVSDRVEVTVDQRRQSNQQLTGTPVGRWEGGPNFAPYFVPIPRFNFIVGSREVLQGYQQRVTNPSEKYRVWESNQVVQLDTVQNHRGFTITQFTSELVSRFHPTDPTITIKTDLIDLPGTTGGNVQFKDPWYIDFDDPQYGNNRRNRGHDEAYPHTRSSPFNPNYDYPFPEGTYKGVFLNQGNPPYWDQPYYSVGAPSPNTIGDIESYFVNWAGHLDSLEYQNANAQQTGVVVKTANATAATTPFCDFSSLFS